MKQTHKPGIHIKPGILDIAVFAAGLAAVVLVSLAVFSGAGGSLSAEISSPAGEWIEPLDADRDVAVEGPLGTTYVHIENGEAAIVDSPCVNKLCIAMGRISKNNQWVACLPNNVFVKIAGRADKDGVDASSF